MGDDVCMTTTATSPYCSFDFYTVEVSASTLKPMLAAGIERSKCSRRRTKKYRVYGRATYPIYRWEATVGFVDVGQDASAQLAAIESRYQAEGVTVRVIFHPRD